MLIGLTWSCFMVGLALSFYYLTTKKLYWWQWLVLFVFAGMVIPIEFFSEVYVTTIYRPEMSIYSVAKMHLGGIFVLYPIIWTLTPLLLSYPLFLRHYQKIDSKVRGISYLVYIQFIYCATLFFLYRSSAINSYEWRGSSVEPNLADGIIIFFPIFGTLLLYILFGVTCVIERVLKRAIRRDIF